MAETVFIPNPNKTVLLPDKNALDKMLKI